MVINVSYQLLINGYFLIKHLIDDDTVNQLISELSLFEKTVNHYGVRDLMHKVPYIHDWARSEPLLSVVQTILGQQAKPVRAVFFDKVPDANWGH